MYVKVRREQATRFAAWKTRRHLFSRKMIVKTLSFADGISSPSIVHPKAREVEEARSKVWRVPNKRRESLRNTSSLLFRPPSLLLPTCRIVFLYFCFAVRLSFVRDRAYQVTLIVPLFVAPFSDRSRRVASRERRMNRSRRSELTTAPWYF